MRSSSTQTSIVSRGSGILISQMASGSIVAKLAESTSKMPMCFGRRTFFSVIGWRLRPLPIQGTARVPAGHRGVRHLSLVRRPVAR